MWKWMRKLRRSSWGVGAWLYGYCAYLCTQRIDLDYGWHYRSGQYILAHGIPRHDIFSYTAKDFVWVNHEWLNDVFMFTVAHRWGYDMLGLVMAVLWTAAIMLTVKSRRLVWAAAGLAMGALLLYVGVRPVAWTALGLALILRLLASGRPRYWLMVPMFAVWANLHAGFALGLVVVGLKVIVDRSSRLAMWSIFAFLATLCNPYGYGVYIELWRTMTDGKLASRIVEWGPLAINYSVAPYVLAVIVVLIMEDGWSFVRLRGAGLVAAALWTNRQLPLMVVGTLDLVNERLEQALDLLQSWNGYARAAASLLLGVVFPLAALQWPPRTNGGISVPQPVKALAVLKAYPCRAHIFNDYNYGGFMIWNLPGVPDYIDGRMPSWRGPDGSYLDQYVEVLKGGFAADRQFARYNIQCALLTNYDKKLSTHLRQKLGWRLVQNENGTQLWRRD